jgi:hypothetical protein
MRDSDSKPAPLKGGPEPALSGARLVRVGRFYGNWRTACTAMATPSKNAPLRSALGIGRANNGMLV